MVSPLDLDLAHYAVRTLPHATVSFSLGWAHKIFLSKMFTTKSIWGGLPLWMFIAPSYKPLIKCRQPWFELFQFFTSPNLTTSLDPNFSPQKTNWDVDIYLHKAACLCGLFFLYNVERHVTTTISIKSLMQEGSRSNYVSSGLFCRLISGHNLVFLTLLLSIIYNA